MSKIEEERRKEEDKTVAKAKEAFEQRDSAAVRKLSEVLKDVNAVQYVYVESLNCKVPYKPLKVEHLQVLRQKKEVGEASTLMLYLMLKGADDSVTTEDVKNIPLDIASDMILKMTKTFLLKPQ